MPKFMDVHGFVGVTQKVFCLSTGPNKEAAMRVHEKAGHGTSEVYELPVEVA